MNERAFFVVIGFFVVVMVVVSAFVSARYPPIHCRYMVAVRSHPGVYSCSQYPMVKP